MKNRSAQRDPHLFVRPLAATFCLLLFATAVRAEDDDGGSPVDALMDRIARGMKKLSRQFDSEAARTSSLELVGEMIKANAEAASLEPASVGDRSGEEREKYLARYAEGMAELGQCLANLKAALEAGDIGRVEELIDEAYALRKKYHDELL